MVSRIKFKWLAIPALALGLLFTAGASEAEANGFAIQVGRVGFSKFNNFGGYYPSYRYGSRYGVGFGPTYSSRRSFDYYSPRGFSTGRSFSRSRSFSRGFGGGCY